MKIRTQLAALAAVAMLGGLAACGGDDDEAAPAPEPAAPAAPAATDEGDEEPADAAATITMMDNTFAPTSLTVKPGATIAVVNKGKARHDLTDDKDIDSGDIDGGESGTVTAPAEAGTYPYKCTYHFGMGGELKVS